MLDGLTVYVRSGDASSVVAVVIASVAVLISLVALWRSHFTRFKIISTTSPMSISIYPFRSEDDRWFILSLETSVSLTNVGARPGQILWLRMALRFPEHPNRQDAVYLPAVFVITNNDEKLSERGRFGWLSAATRLWTPSLLLSKATCSESVLFERRIDLPIVGDMKAQLEVFSQPKGNWQAFGEWRFGITPKSFASAISRKGGRHTWIPPVDTPDRYGDKDPSELLKSVSIPIDQLPSDLSSRPVYLDYEEDFPRDPK